MRAALPYVVEQGSFDHERRFMATASVRRERSPVGRKALFRQSSRVHLQPLTY
jgi:hypothetical protein